MVLIPYLFFPFLLKTIPALSCFVLAEPLSSVRHTSWILNLVPDVEKAENYELVTFGSPGLLGLRMTR